MNGALTLAVELAWWQQTGIRAVVGLLAVLLPAGTLVYLFLFKMMSFMQSRLGPMEAGPYGSLQLLAEVGKFLQKEDIFPRKADRWVFMAAPFVVLISTFLLVLVIPAGPDAWFIDVDTGVFFALAVSSISVIGILMAGWASSSKYSLLGALRAAGQLVAYELPLVLAVMGVVIQAGTLNVQEIVLAQANGEIFGWGAIGNPFVITQFLGFEALDVSTPLFAFLFLVALGVDYNIFLVTRAREEAPTHGTGPGVLRALSATGGVITSAGVLLAAVFATLGVLPLVVLAQLGVVIGIGVLLDTLLVRTVLVPSLVVLLGERFWWPRRVSRAAPPATPDGAGSTR